MVVGVAAGLKVLPYELAEFDVELLALLVVNGELAMKVEATDGFGAAGGCGGLTIGDEELIVALIELSLVDDEELDAKLLE